MSNPSTNPPPRQYPTNPKGYPSDSWNWRAPDYFRAIYGIRFWRVADAPSGPVLGSFAMPIGWPRDKALRAECVPYGFLWRQQVKKPVDVSPDHSPSQTCGCGIWAMYDPKQLIIEGGVAAFSAVWGVVKLWGRVVVGERGFRAEYAQPASLFISPPQPSRFEQLLIGIDNRQAVPEGDIQRLADTYSIPLIDRWPDDLTNPKDFTV